MWWASWGVGGFWGAVESLSLPSPASRATLTWFPIRNTLHLWHKLIPSSLMTGMSCHYCQMMNRKSPSKRSMSVRDHHPTQEGKAPVTMSYMTNEPAVIIPHKSFLRGCRRQGSHSFNLLWEAVTQKILVYVANVTSLYKYMQRMFRLWTEQFYLLFLLSWFTSKFYNDCFCYYYS